MKNTTAKTSAHQFRQTRQENDGNELTITISGKNGFLRNWSRTGIGFEFFDNELHMNPGEIIPEVTIQLETVELFKGSIEIKQKENGTKGDGADNGLCFYGAAFHSGLFNVEGVESARAILVCSKALTGAIEEVQTVSPEICQIVLELRAILDQIREVCRKEEQRWVQLPFDRRAEAEAVFLPNIAREVHRIMTICNVKVGKLVDVQRLPENSAYHRVFQREIYSFFGTADLVKRAFEKPRGYAGDYEMMNQIYRSGFEGADLFGRVLHNYVASETSSESVKFRKGYFMNHYREVFKSRRPGQQIKTLSIACGPATEMQQIVTDWPQADLEQLHSTLFDLDSEALDHAQTKTLQAAAKLGKKPNLAFINASVKTFLSENAISKERYDLIYSGGLFDYLDNATSASLTRKFSEMLKPGGRLVIGNFTDENPTKAFCHLVTNWTLIHKTAKEIEGWAKGANYDTLRVEFDESRINAFLVLIRNAVD